MKKFKDLREASDNVIIEYYELDQSIQEYIKALTEEYLAEEAAEGKASADTKGRLHELLTGYHLHGGKHMTRHADVSGDSPEQAHDKLKASISHEEYSKINERAKGAAADIKNKVEQGGHKVHDVQWTSKPGDLKRATGIHASQKEDASDVVVSTKKGKQVKHHGVSLKVTDSGTKHVPVSNFGAESTHGGQAILDAHRTAILKKYPSLKAAKNAGERKEILKSNPHMSEDIKNKNRATLENVAKNLHNKLQAMPKKDLVHHIKKVLHSDATPMQAEGHGHLRHTSYVAGGGKNAYHSIDPSSHHSHIYNDHDNIEVHHSGASVHFKHNGKTFGRQSVKFNSQSDPMSALKGSGQTSGD
jgi:hypothetical protein